MDEKGFHLHVVGINHFDPLIPPRLSSHLQALAQEHSSPPAFVGVEYAKKVFLEIKAQRPRFRELLRNTWPEMTSKDLEILADSLAYEGDRHLAIFPDSPTLWLEIVRGVLPGTIENYAENRLAMYRERGGSDPSPARISQEIQRIAMDNFDLNRSATFAQTVLNGIRDLHGTWAITVTGSGHRGQTARVRCASSSRLQVFSAGPPSSSVAPTKRSASCLTSNCPALRAVQLSFERHRGATLVASPL